jgi:hypothetical protein
VSLTVVPTLCGCGKETTIKCSELQSPNTLVPCHAPLCKPACPGHRHDAGTMGYPGLMRGRAYYSGDEPDEMGFIKWVQSRCRAIFWSAERKAAQSYKEVCDAFPPPAPWPYLQLQVGLRKFEARGPLGMVEVENWTEHIGANRL